MLRQTANALASDSEFGNNSANQIRDRVEDLAEQMTKDDLSTGLPQKSAGRAVVEARFALGGDNGQYMSQAVAMLWAGDGGERLRIVPPSMMPQIMRHASSEGIIRAMRSVMVTRQAQSMTKINTGLELAGWMMQVDEIRNGVLDYMRQTAFNEVARAADTIEARYTAGDGMEWVMNTLKHSEDIAANYSIAKAIVEAVYALSDTGSYPMQVVTRLLDASEAVVKKAYDDTALVALLGKEIGKEIKAWASFDPAHINEDNTAGFCPTYDANGLRTPDMDGGKPLQREFQTAVAAACSRIGATQKVKYFDVEGGNVAVNDLYDDAHGWKKWDTGNSEFPLGKQWYLERVLTPLWNQGPRVYPYSPTDKGAFYTGLGDGAIGGSNVQSANETLSTLMRTQISLVNDTGAARATLRGGLPRTPPEIVSTQSTDPWMIDFCILRGLCGYQGPHQTLPSSYAERLPYNYPTTEMRSYYSAGLYSNPVRMPEITLGAEARAEIAVMMNANYASVERRVDQRTNAVVKGIELDTDYFGYAWRGSTNTSGIETAKEVNWAPIKTDAAAGQGAAGAASADENNDVDYSPTSLNICEASMYEMMAKALIKRADAIKTVAGPTTPPVMDAQIRTLRAGAAAAKIRQLQCMAYIATEAGQYQGMIKKPANTLPERMVTRPSQQCAAPQHNHVVEKLLIPVDAGIARFVHASGAAAPVVGPTIPERALGSTEDTYVINNDGIEVLVQCETLSSWLRRGAEKGWREYTQPPAAAEVRGLPDRFGLRLGLSADTQPFTPTPEALSEWIPEMQKFGWLAPADFTFENIHKVAAHAIKASIEVLQLMQEEEYITRLETDGSPERQGVFGLNTDKTVEDASRSRRADVWSDAMREVAVSGDRLYRFVTAVTGAIGESADSAISWEDEDLKQLSKDAATRQKALSERVSRFQTKLVESVVSSTLKGSKLQLDMRGKTPDDQQLVVLSADVKDSIRQITDGEAGHGFFEASVEINEALGRSARPMTIQEIVANLQNVSHAFHNQVAASMAPFSGASYARITEPRNSFMLHLKPDTLAAIQKAYDYIVSEMRHCGGYHRPINLWEFVEGKDWVMSTRFAELVGLMLQNTRMRSGSFAAYVGTPQLIANGHNIRMQIQRLRTQVCYYLHTQMDMPMWLYQDGRTYYFGGTPKKHITPEMEKRETKRQKTYDAGADFGGDDGDDRFDRPDKAPRVPKPIIRRDVLNRMLQVARARRNEMRRSIMEGRPGPLQGYSLKDMLDYLDAPQKFVSEFGATRGDSMRMSIAHVDQQVILMPNAEKLSTLAGLYMLATWLATSPVAMCALTDPKRVEGFSTDRALGKSLCEQLLDPEHKSVVRLRQYELSSNGIYLKQPFDMGETMDVTIDSKETQCHVVRIDITGKNTVTKPPNTWQNLKGNDHVNKAWVGEEIDLELNTIFMMDVTATDRPWRPHPGFLDLSGPVEHTLHNVWIKPYDARDTDLALGGTKAWWLVQHLMYTHRLLALTAMSMVGATLMARYLTDAVLMPGDDLGTPEGDTFAGESRAFNFYDDPNNTDTPRARDVTSRQTEAMRDLLRLGCSMVDYFQGRRDQSSYNFLKSAQYLFDTPSVSLDTSMKKCQTGMFVTEAEVMVNNTRMRLSAAQKFVKSRPDNDPHKKEVQQAVDKLQERVDSWNTVQQSYYAPGKLTEDHKRAINNATLNWDSPYTAYCVNRETSITAPRDKEFDGCRDFNNGVIKCLVPLVNNLVNNVFERGGAAFDTIKQVGGATGGAAYGWLTHTLNIYQQADELGISVHIISRENIPQTIKKALVLKLTLDDNMIQDPTAALLHAEQRDRLHAQIQFYLSTATKLGGMLAVARGNPEEFIKDVEKATADAYEESNGGVRTDSTWKGYIEKHWTLAFARMSGNSAAVHENNYKALSEAGQSLLATQENWTTYGTNADIAMVGILPIQQSLLPPGLMPTSGSAGHKPDLSRWSTPQLEVRPPSLKVGMISGDHGPVNASYYKIQTERAAQMSADDVLTGAWNAQTGRGNFPAWVRGDGKQIIFEQLMRLSTVEYDAAKKKVEGKMAEMSAPEKSEYSFGVYVAFVVELVNELWDNHKLNLSDANVFPLPTPSGTSRMGSRGEAAEMFTDSCYNVWEGRFGGSRCKEAYPPPGSPAPPLEE